MHVRMNINVLKWFILQRMLNIISQNMTRLVCWHYQLIKRFINKNLVLKDVTSTITIC